MKARGRCKRIEVEEGGIPMPPNDRLLDRSGKFVTEESRRRVVDRNYWIAR